MPHLIGGVGNLSFRRLGSGPYQLRARDQARSREARPTYGYAKRAEEFSTVYGNWLVHGVLPGCLMEQFIFHSKYHSDSGNLTMW